MLSLPFVRLALACAFALGGRAQLSGSVGPTTPLSEKSNLCNVLDYGGSIGSSDIGPAIQSAFDDCVLTNSSASTLYVPAGTLSPSWHASSESIEVGQCIRRDR